MIPEMIPLVFVVAAIVVARCFTEPLADASEVIDKSEFKSLQQGLYNKKNTMQYEDDS
jgi:hypothetical protein